MAEDWLKYKKPNLRESTHKQHRGHIKNHLKLGFGPMAINRVNFDAMEKYMRKATKNGMTAPTLKKVLTTLGGILKYATRKRYITTDVCNVLFQ